MTKQEHAFKGFASTYNVKILNPFNPELELKDTESTIKNKLLELLTQYKNLLEKVEAGLFIQSLLSVFQSILL